jgi:HK97 family phage major capsid protein
MEETAMREITKEQAKDLFRDVLKSAGIDWDELVAKQLQPVIARLEEKQTSHMETITRGFHRKAESDTGLTVGGMVRMLAMAKGDQDRAVEMAKKIYGLEHGIVKALMAGDATAGGFLVPPNFSAEVIELLRPMSVVRSLDPVIWPMPNGSAQISKLTGGADASYSGESRNITSSQQATGMLNLFWKKLTALVPISNDLLRFSGTNPGADGIVRDDLVGAMGQREDLAFIRNDGTSGTPKGMRYWCPAANLITVNATVNLANVTVDLGKLVLALEEASVRFLRPGWVFAPRTKLFLMTIRDGNGNYAFREEMLTGKFWGFPFKSTPQIPKNLAYTGTGETETYLADFADCVIGEATELIIDASPNAAYYDSASAAVVSSFSRDETVIRAISRHDFGMRHDESVAIHPDVDWA